MSARIITQRARRRRRLITYLWIAALAAITISLIYYEQTAILYVLATLGVTALLVIVASADLAHAEQGAVEIPAGATSPATAPNEWGARKKL
jgi:peptidoglycan/LPS O-acetylase OafA/YrhL